MHVLVHDGHDQGRGAALQARRGEDVEEEGEKKQKKNKEICDVFLNLRHGSVGPVCCGDSHFSGITAARLPLTGQIDSGDSHFRSVFNLSLHSERQGLSLALFTADCTHLTAAGPVKADTQRWSAVCRAPRTCQHPLKNAILTSHGWISIISNINPLCDTGAICTACVPMKFTSTVDVLTSARVAAAEMG